MSSVDRDPFLYPPSGLGGVPTGMVHGDGPSYDELLREHLAKRFGELPSLAPHEVMALIYPQPRWASVGAAGAAPQGTMPLSPEQEAYIARARSTVHGEWSVIREREAAERGRLANIAVSLIRERGPIVIEGEAIAGEYEDRFTVGGFVLDDLLFDAEVEGQEIGVTSPGRVRVTIEFLEEVSDV